MDILNESLDEAEELRRESLETSNHYINDIRQELDFKTTTFSMFNRNSVKKEFMRSLIETNVEASVFWCAECVVSGMFLEVWEIVFLFMSKHVHTGSPKLPIYTHTMYSKFRDLITPYATSGTLLSARNAQEIRELFTELIVVMVTSRKKPVITNTKIDKKTCFNMVSMTEKTVAPAIKYEFKEDDPKEFFIALNEFAHHVSPESNDIIMAGYWLEWTIAFTAQCRKNKQDLSCEARTILPTEYKHQKEPMGIIWEILVTEAKRRKNRLTVKIVESLMALFYVRYTGGAATRRKFIVYFAIELIVDMYSNKIPIMTNPKFVHRICDNRNIPYMELKKSEQAPATGYLEHNAGAPKTDAERSMARIKYLSESGLF